LARPRPSGRNTCALYFYAYWGGGDLDLSRMAQTQRRRRRGAQDTTRTPRRSGYSPTRRSVLPSLARSATVALRNLMAVGYPGPTCRGASCAPRATTFPVMSPPGTSCGWLFRHLRIPLLLPLSPHRTTKNRVDARTAVETHVPLRVAGQGGGRRRCVQGCAQPGAAGAKTNHATQNRRKHKRPEWGGIGIRVLLAFALRQRRSCPCPRAS